MVEKVLRFNSSKKYFYSPKADKQRILSAGMGSGGANPGLPDITLTAREDVTRSVDSL